VSIKVQKCWWEGTAGALLTDLPPSTGCEVGVSPRRLGKWCSHGLPLHSSQQRSLLEGWLIPLGCSWDDFWPEDTSRLAGSQLRDGKTHVALQSPAVVQHPLSKTTITGFLENQLAVLPFAGHGAAGGSTASGCWDASCTLTVSTSHFRSIKAHYAKWMTVIISNLD